MDDVFSTYLLQTEQSSTYDLCASHNMFVNALIIMNEVFRCPSIGLTAATTL